MAEMELTELTLTEDMTDVEAYGNNNSYICGENTFEVAGMTMHAQPGGNVRLRINHTVLEGENKGRRLSQFFTMKSTNPDAKKRLAALGTLKKYLEQVWQKKITGTPKLDKSNTIGVRFTASIMKKHFKRKDGTDGESFEIDLDSIKVVGRSPEIQAQQAAQSALPT